MLLNSAACLTERMSLKGSFVQALATESSNHGVGRMVLQLWKLLFYFFYNWGMKIQQFTISGAVDYVFGGGGDEVVRVGDGNFVDNDNWGGVVYSNEANKFVVRGKDGRPQVFEAMENDDSMLQVPCQDD
jgi:hypothetical protein